ncbi:MAG: PAS domain-containing protein, partial [Vicinamibacterales bacterium]
MRERALIDEQIIRVDTSREPDESLRRSEARYRTLATASAQIIWIGSPEGVVIDVSDSWVTVTGHPKDAALGRRFLELVPVEDIDHFMARRTQALLEGRTFETEFRLRHADGHDLHVRSRSVPVLDEDGHVIERIGTLTDLTAEKVAEQARRASEDRFSTAFYKSALPMTLRIPGGGPILDVNDAWVALTGYSRAEAVGTDGNQIQWLDPADVARLTERFR